MQSKKCFSPKRTSEDWMPATILEHNDDCSTLGSEMDLPSSIYAHSDGAAMSLFTDLAK